MIHLLRPLTLRSHFSIQDLPDPLQLSLFGSMVVPRIVSSSMAPTIQEGDRLELSPPTSLGVGTIVVFRHDTMLVCHRITAIEPQGTLSTSGDATQGTCEIVQPSSVIGVVTGVTRNGIHMSVGRNQQTSSSAAQAMSLKTLIRTVVVRSVIQNIRVLTKFSVFQHMLAMLLGWSGRVDVLIPTPLRFLPSHFKAASFRLRMFPHRAGLLPAMIRHKPKYYLVRLGPWRLAQYDPASSSLVLHQSLHGAGLEPLVRSMLR